ncbi:NTF2-like protein [Lindgomyces ingoldianus]|uniref:NTF2-like protein n=1 Tax=Lindgomyces ingoldianus TaxID=673940 RepID=A0ACB6RFC6_9PLEO|nr:NTF2-like protein [Lindgomyces ingoldianus]KAF2477750.1 NTF2-like protein [Lindgomyces ingoldianus]
MSIANPTQSGSGFLTFNSMPPRIWLTSSSPHPPEKALLYWKEEGFDATYFPYTPHDQQGYLRTLKALHNDLELGETYALICHGEAASVVLKAAIKPMPKLCALVAYYPTVLPNPKTKYPSLLQIVVHIAGLSQISAPPETCEWKCYRYEHCTSGFVDPAAKQYSEVEANLAWSRTLACVRRGFKRDVDLETIVEEMWRGKYDVDVPEQGSLAVVKNMTQASPHVTILPTLEGGMGRKKLEEFYREFFIPSLVEDFDIRLVSRTIGVDKVVDEMVVSFTHTDEIDWILPGVPPTDRHVEIAVVSVVTARGGKLVSEHMYWDQASILVQVGLLDPKVVPENMRKDGLKRLPVVGAEAARQLVQPRQARYNGLLKEHGLMEGLNGVNGTNSVNGA